MGVLFDLGEPYQAFSELTKKGQITFQIEYKVEVRSSGQVPFILCVCKVSEARSCQEFRAPAELVSRQPHQYSCPAAGCFIGHTT